MGEALVSHRYGYGNSEWNKMIDESLGRLKNMDELGQKVIISEVYARIQC